MGKEWNKRGGIFESLRGKYRKSTNCGKNDGILLKEDEREVERRERRLECEVWDDLGSPRKNIYKKRRNGGKERESTLYGKTSYKVSSVFPIHHIPFELLY